MQLKVKNDKNKYLKNNYRIIMIIPKELNLNHSIIVDIFKTLYIFYWKKIKDQRI